MTYETGHGPLLRPFTPADTAPLAEAFRDPQMALWNPGPNDGDVVGWWTAANDTSDPSHVTWAVGAPDGALLGSVSLFHLDRDQRLAELGFRVLPAARGRGVGRWAAQEATRYAFTTLGLRRVQLYHGALNVASCRVAEASGFRLEGVLRESYRYGDGQWHDEHLHARLATDGAAH